MNNQLHLKNQICFPFYALSRNIIKRYTPHLKIIDLTYPQYLVLLVLWEEENKCIKDICELLWLEINTISPILNTLEKKWIIIKKKNSNNKKEIYISLTQKWKDLEKKVINLPELLLKGVEIDLSSLKNLHIELTKLMKVLDNK